MGPIKLHEKPQVDNTVHTVKFSCEEFHEVEGESTPRFALSQVPPLTPDPESRLRLPCFRLSFFGVRSLREEHLAGLDYLETVTTLMRRRRIAHPTKGLYEAAEVQWWWTVPRRTDSLPQILWFDDDGPPAAAALLIDFTNASSALYTEVTFCPLFLPNATPDEIDYVIGRGLAYAALPATS